MTKENWKPKLFTCDDGSMQMMYESTEGWITDEDTYNSAEFEGYLETLEAWEAEWKAAHPPIE